MSLDKIIRECMSTKESINTIRVSGLAHEIELDIDKVEKYRDYVTDLLDNILDEGENISSYNINKDKSGNNWGTHFDGELLIILGKALGIIKLIPANKGFPIVVRDEMNKILVKSI